MKSPSSVMDHSSSRLPAPPSDTVAGHMQRFIERLQYEICDAIEAEDGEARFRTDFWNRDGGGGGRSRVLEDGAVFEKAGVNVSAVHGLLPEKIAKGLQVDEAPFFATGLSLIIHPQSPFVPSVHANFRYFAMGGDLANPDDQWFGGGADLTPCYPYLEDAQHFHATWKGVCDAHEVADYAAFKAHCDRYFYLPHRKETRGIGGIFFDYLRNDPQVTLPFVQDAASAFLEAYMPIVKRRRGISFTDAQKNFQEIRRGRYVEFNLLFDRGTRFGIETDGRTESILMSLPAKVQWVYDFQPEPGSPEEAAQWFFVPRDWLQLTPDTEPLV